MKKLFSAVAVSVSMLLGGVASAEDVNITLVTHGQANDPFWSIIQGAAQEAGKNYDVNVEYRAPETFNMVEMAQLIQAAINEEPDGLVVSIPDGEALSDSIRAAVDAGIPVISINSGSNVSAELGALLHVGQEEYDAGEKAGARLAKLGGKKALCINHEVGNVSLDQRCEGFEKGFGGTVKVIPVTNDPADIKSKVRAALESDESIDTVLTLGASLAGEPAISAIQDLGKGDSVAMASFDLSGNFLEAVSQGNAEFAIDQQPYLQGYLPVAFLALHAKYGVVPGGNVPSGPNLVGKDSAAQVIDLASKGIR